MADTPPNDLIIGYGKVWGRARGDIVVFILIAVAILWVTHTEHQALTSALDHLTHSNEALVCMLALDQTERRQAIVNGSGNICEYLYATGSSPRKTPTP